MIWNISAEEKRIAAELLQFNIDFGVEFAKLPTENHVRIAPLNRSTRPQPGTKIPPEYHYLLDGWVTQDLLFTYLEELTTSTRLFGWNPELSYFADASVPGLRGDELVYVLKLHRESLRKIMELPWYRDVRRKVRAFIRLNVPEKPVAYVRSNRGVIAGREVL